MKNILLLILFCGLLYGQEVKKITITESEVQQLIKTVGAVEAELQLLSEKPTEAASKRVKHLEKVISTLPDKQPTKPGRITMKQHLQNKKAEIEKSPAAYVVQETERLINTRDILNSEIQTKTEEIQKELNNEKIK